LLDPQYSSSDVRIVHDGIALSRLDKVKLVVDSQAALENVRVCLENVQEMLNCGQCEKCIRTMTELEAIGALSKSSAFPHDRLSAKLLSTVVVTSGYQASCYRELIGPLSERGRTDLVRVIRRLVAPKPLKHVKVWCLRNLRAFDRRCLGGTMRWVKKRLLRL